MTYRIVCGPFGRLVGDAVAASTCAKFGSACTYQGSDINIARLHVLVASRWGCRIARRHDIQGIGYGDQGIGILHARRAWTFDSRVQTLSSVLVPNAHSTWHPRRIFCTSLGADATLTRHEDMASISDEASWLARYAPLATQRMSMATSSQISAAIGDIPLVLATRNDLPRGMDAIVHSLLRMLSQKLRTQHDRFQSKRTITKRARDEDREASLAVLIQALLDRSSLRSGAVAAADNALEQPTHLSHQVRVTF